MSKSKTILLIDDEKPILEGLSAFFEDIGYQVITAQDGELGLEKFSKENIDIVLTDLRMPKMDGLEVMRSIAETDPDIPLIIISGAGRKEDIIKALRMGAKDYITKPVDLDMLRHTVQQVLETKRLSDENEVYRRQLEKSESKYRTITENIAEGVFSVDENEYFTYSNQAFSRMIGYSVQEILVRNLKDVSTAKSYRIILEQTEKRMTGITDRYIIEMISRDRKPVHVELVCSPVFNTENKYNGTISVARDITQIVELKKKYNQFLKKQEKAQKNLTPICAGCKNIRVDKNVWIPVEEYFRETVFSHSICPACSQALYPELDLSELDE